MKSDRIRDHDVFLVSKEEFILELYSKYQNNSSLLSLCGTWYFWACGQSAATHSQNTSLRFLNHVLYSSTKFNEIQEQLHVEYIAGLDNVRLARILPDHPPPVMPQTHPCFTCCTTPYLSSNPPDNIRWRFNHGYCSNPGCKYNHKCLRNSICFSLLCFVVAATIIIDKN